MRVIKWGVGTAAVVSLCCSPITGAHAQEELHFWGGSQQYLTCGEHVLEVTTTCSKTEDGDSYCFQQNLTFGRFDASDVHQKNIKHLSNNGNEDFIASATCITKKQKNYVVLGGTNFGNCRDGCEWIDVLTENGNYIGSSVGLYKDSSFHRRVLQKNSELKFNEVEELLGKSHSNSTIDIHR